MGPLDAQIFDLKAVAVRLFAVIDRQALKSAPGPTVQNEAAGQVVDQPSMEELPS